jgi:hypothetical protein
LHPRKTRIIKFGRLAKRKRKPKTSANRKPSPFSPSHTSAERAGGFLILRHEQLREKLRQIKETIWPMTHRPIAE